VDGTDAVAIAKACIELLSDPDRSQAMGKAGRKWIEQSWSWDLWAKKFTKTLSL